MFGSEVKQEIAYLKADIKFLEKYVETMNDRHWELYRRHTRLLEHLNLCEHTPSQEIQLVPLKSCPEQTP